MAVTIKPHGKHLPVDFAAGVVLCTPFDENDGVNFHELDRLIDFQLNGGTEAIFFTGVAGEGPSMEEAEFARVVSHAAARCRGRCLVGACTAAASTRKAERLSRIAAECGAQVLLVAAPFYVRATPDGLAAHYAAIAEAAGLPVIVSNIPLRTGVTMERRTVLRLAALPGIVGLKDLSGDIQMVEEVLQEAPEGFRVWSGNDNAAVPYMSLGAAGVISVAGNLVPGEIAALTGMMRRGAVAGAAALQLRLMPLIRSLFIEVNPIPVKTGLRMMGFEMGAFRLPLCAMEAPNEAALRAVLERYDLIGKAPRGREPGAAQPIARPG